MFVWYATESWAHSFITESCKQNLLHRGKKKRTLMDRWLYYIQAWND
jgi:hypothetical protein